MTRHLQQSSGLSQPSKRLTFKDLYRFVDIQRIPNALEFVAHTYGRSLPFEMSDIVGRAMVSRETYTPVGFAFVWFEPSGVCSIQAHYGEYFRQYPKDVLASMAPTVRQVRDVGVNEIVAIADEDIPGADTLVLWMGGKPTGQRSEVPRGEIYTIDLWSDRIESWLQARGEKGEG